MTDHELLRQLIDEVNHLREQTTFYPLDTENRVISYMPTKKTSFVGLKQGYSDLLVQSQKGMKESDRLRSSVKDYLRFVRNAEGELLQIERFNKGRMDCLFQAHRLGETRYLFPFSSSGGFYPTYVYATRYEAGRVAEEYMVNGRQIIYEAYDYASENSVEYTLVNHVAGGNNPVRERRKGIFRLDPLAYEETLSESWLDQ